MTAISDANRESARHANGKFGAQPHTVPEQSLERERVMLWLVEGDDHEARVYEAASAQDAEELAQDDFADQYHTDVDNITVTVVAAFTGDVDEDTEDWNFLPGHGSASTERRARRILESAEY